MPTTCERASGPTDAARSGGDDPSPARALAREAAQSLAEAVALSSRPPAPGQREEHRSLLELAIERASRALALEDGETRQSALLTLVKAHAARAEDALHGAGQLSLGSQRAPTVEACDEGWCRVETIVSVAEASAHAAEVLAAELEAGSPTPAVARAARAAASRASSAARAARRLLDQRNHAYTFHTDHGFSFGEGWYLAAAGVLAGVAIQIEPGKPATAQAERFLLDAGLGDRLLPYRSRPRANKHTTDIIARCFRADPMGAQARLRASFLGDAPMNEAVRGYIDGRLPRGDGRPKALIWVRVGAHHAGRNSTAAELVELTRRVQQAGMVPVFLGDALAGFEVPEGAVDMIFFWKDPIFRAVDGRLAQLQFFEHLRREHGVVGQLGVTTAGMDGPALLGLPTMYLTEASNVRMRQWVGAVPGYREVVREGQYLEEMSRVLGEWAAAQSPKTAQLDPAPLLLGPPLEEGIEVEPGGLLPLGTTMGVRASLAQVDGGPAQPPGLALAQTRSSLANGSTDSGSSPWCLLCSWWGPTMGGPDPRRKR